MGDAFANFFLRGTSERLGRFSRKRGFVMSQSHKVLPGTHRIPLPGARVLGSVSADEWIEVTVKLRRKAALPELEGRPKKPMSYEQLTKTYGCEQEDITKVAEALHEFGLEVVESD